MSHTWRSLFNRKTIGFAIALAVAVYFASCLIRGSGASETQYRTATIKRANLDVTINATGTIEPEELVDIGTQVAGQIRSFGKNSAGSEVDYGIEVEEGTILAQIDDSLYLSDVAQAEAQMKRAKADVLQLQAKLKQAEADWKRAQTLSSSEALAKSSFDAYKAGYDVAVANVAVGEAAVTQAEATVFKAQRNLGYTTIKSPVKGVIIDRRVNIGQTVVSSLNAPSLFLIAKDLKRMQVWVAVNEADIGSISVGQKVSYTVDAFPNRVFAGEVGKIRLNASMTQNVVTYVVEVNTDNSDGVLLPYLTASVEFHVTHHQDVLLVPNSALRWSPARDKPEEGGRGRARIQTSEPAPADLEASGTIWVLDLSHAPGDEPQAIKVNVGGTNGILTEVSADTLREGMEVIVAEERPAASAAAATTNPFAPTIPRGGRRN